MLDIACEYLIFSFFITEMELRNLNINGPLIKVRFLLIHSEQEETISSQSPFLVHKTIMSLTGEPKSIKTLRSGDLLIQCAKESLEKTLLQMKTFCNLKCSVKPHSSLNTSKGIVRCPALSKVTTEHIIEFMGEQGVTDIRRITVRRDGILKPTNTFVLTFNTPILPTVVPPSLLTALPWFGGLIRTGDFIFE